MKRVKKGKVKDTKRQSRRSGSEWIRLELPRVYTGLEEAKDFADC